MIKNRSAIFRKISVIAIGACLAFTLLAPSRTFGQGDGPRAYFPAPDGVNLIAGYGLFLRGNRSLDPGTVFSDGSIDLNIGILQYTRSFGVVGQAAGAFAVVPFGEVSGTIRGGFATFEGSTCRLDDIFVGAAFTLYGMPAMPKEEFITFDPGFALGLLTKVITPSGEYNSSEVINLGANRWAAQLGLPLFYYFGDSLVASDLATIEVIPSVLLFGDNTDASGGGSLEQDPLFQLESHITKNINRALWLSLDSLIVYGGETSKDGTVADNEQRSLSLGGTVGINLSNSLSVKFSYGGVVDRNNNGPDGEMLRVVVNLLF